MKTNHPGTKKAMSDDVRQQLGSDLWRMVKNALIAGLSDRGIELPNEEASFGNSFYARTL